MNQEDFLTELTCNPHQLYYDFKMTNIFIARFIPSTVDIDALLSVGAIIDPKTCIVNYRHEAVSHLIHLNRLVPENYIHDFCITPYHRDRPRDFLETLKVLISHINDLNVLDSQDRTIMECMKNNRQLKWIGEPYLRKEMKRRQKAVLDAHETNSGKFLID